MQEAQDLTYVYIQFYTFFVILLASVGIATYTFKKNVVSAMSISIIVGALIMNTQFVISIIPTALGDKSQYFLIINIIAVLLAQVIILIATAIMDSVSNRNNGDFIEDAIVIVDEGEEIITVTEEDNSDVTEATNVESFK